MVATAGKNIFTRKFTPADFFGIWMKIYFVIIIIIIIIIIIDIIYSNKTTEYFIDKCVIQHQKRHICC